MAFKMRNNPMQRNFGIGGPMKNDPTGKKTKKTKEEIENYKVPSPEEQVRLQEAASKTSGKDLVYWDLASKRAGEHTFRQRQQK